MSREPGSLKTSASNSSAKVNCVTRDEHFASEGDDAICDVEKVPRRILQSNTSLRSEHRASLNVQKPASPRIRPSFFSCNLLFSGGFSFSAFSASTSSTHRSRASWSKAASTRRDAGSAAHRASFRASDNLSRHAEASWCRDHAASHPPSRSRSCAALATRRQSSFSNEPRSDAKMASSIFGASNSTAGGRNSGSSRVVWRRDGGCVTGLVNASPAGGVRAYAALRSARSSKSVNVMPVFGGTSDSPKAVASKRS
mmetsp:Transcript_2321/g.6512  ORF Transcript_2321/g.6512 Transcript_2321/m.6512 type:complete len:255 (-) Transcript_2321:7874-8638(-)